MIVQTGMRTDIPAFYTPWLLRRLAEGFVLVRNPYNHHAVTRYELSPAVVDMLVFCSKNPGPLLPHLAVCAPFGQYWFVTITPYGRDVEPNVPDWHKVVAQFRHLAAVVGMERVAWRYDPVVMTRRYTEDFHKEAFAAIAGELRGHTCVCVVSFIDIYAKVRRNFPGAQVVPLPVQERLAQAFVREGERNGMTIRACAENEHLIRFGMDCAGCMTQAVYEQALGQKLQLPKGLSQARKECACVMGNDIGAYNSCPHLCRYCYANANPVLVQKNISKHDPTSPLLIGGLEDGDVVRDAKQVSWRAGYPIQLRLV